MRSIAIASLPSVTSPARRHGPVPADCSSVRSVSQATTRARVVGLDLGRSLELYSRRGRAEAPAETQLGGAGRAQIQRLDLQAIGVGFHLDVHPRQQRARERHALDRNAQRRGNWQLRHRDQGFGHGPDGGQWLAARCVGQRQHPVQVDLRRRQDAGDVRPRAKCKIGAAAQLDGPVVRSVLELDLIQQGRRAVALDAAGHAPGIDDERLRADGSPADRTICTLPSNRGVPCSVQIVTSASVVSGG
jgi:hypothetical protein